MGDVVNKNNQRLRGETIFTMETPLPTVQRITVGIISVFMILVIWRVLQDVENSRHSLLTYVFRWFLYSAIGVWGLVGIAAFFRLPPFDPKRKS